MSVFVHLFDDNLTFRHLFIIILKCPAELNFDCQILSTGVTRLLSRGDIFNILHLAQTHAIFHALRRK